MIERPLKDVTAWVQYFEQVDVPVLKRTVETLAHFQAHEDDLDARELADAIMHDPLMTLRVLRFLQVHHSRRVSREITTIAHALMMVGTTPFFQHFSKLPVVEDVLKDQVAGLTGLRRAMSRARHAALFAQDWAVLRHDIESDEVMIAALLRDLAEMLMWCFAPRLMMTVRALMQREKGMRSADAQKRVLGFRGIELQLALVRAWHLPQLLQTLMDEDHADHPRVKNVALAVRLSRHLANGWDDPALPDDYRDIAEFLHLPEEAVRARILKTALLAARSWTWYGVPPVAAGLPLIAAAKS
ncbi:HDOD domain-containing protein [Thiobacter aerophilum]|uniref:HDOD domain-containing protein n=1 Tax=Thiobacter aerophilum TaxID=3121275 RepID=A0ABV0ECG3_9BURK